MEEYDLMLELKGDDDQRARQILEFRGWQKALTSFYRPYINLLAKDGRLHPSFKMHGTVTGRLSCSLPNLQQIPRKGEKPWNDRTKQCFIPEIGYDNIEFDYKTLEFRLAAMYAENQELIERINDGEDIHQATTDMIKDKTNLEYERQHIKTTNFLKLYGGGPDKLSLQLKVKDHVRGGWNMIPEKSCRCKSCVINRAWNETFPEMRMVMISVTDKAYAQGYIKYWSGRRKHYNTYWNRGEEHKGFNALCQGGGAEVVKHALINCKDLESDQMRPILTVHDSLLWEIKSELVDDAIEKISSVMRNFNFPVKMEVDAHRWGE
jgi:DNA polymerase-1